MANNTKTTDTTNEQTNDLSAFVLDEHDDFGNIGDSFKAEAEADKDTKPPKQNTEKEPQKDVDANKDLSEEEFEDDNTDKDSEDEWNEEDNKLGENEDENEEDDDEENLESDEGKKEKPKDNKPSDDEGSDDDTDSPDFSIFANELAQKMQIPLEQEELLEAMGENSIEGVINFVDKVIEANSTYEFVSPEAQQLEQFVAQGGDPKTFFEAYTNNSNYTGITLEEEDVNTQKKVLQDKYKKAGVSEKRISKLIEAIEEEGSLFNEARDALIEFQKIEQQELQQIQEEQKKYAESQRKAQENYIQNTIEAIKSNNVNETGFKLTPTEQRELPDYIFSRGRDGKSAFQKDLEKIGNYNLRLAIATKRGILSDESLAAAGKPKAIKEFENQFLKKIKKNSSGKSGGKATKTETQRKTTNFDEFVL